MGLFDGTKRRHLNDLEREVLANPTPQNMVSLIERYMAAAARAPTSRAWPGSASA
jgi:hypothetical protein